MIPQGIRDENAGHPMNRILLAGALDMGAASSAYRDLIAAANKFGLISGNYNSENISLTELGVRVTAAESDRGQADRTPRGDGGGRALPRRCSTTTATAGSPPVTS